MTRRRVRQPPPGAGTPSAGAAPPDPFLALLDGQLAARATSCLIVDTDDLRGEPRACPLAEREDSLSAENAAFRFEGVRDTCLRMHPPASPLPERARGMCLLVYLRIAREGFDATGLRKAVDQVVFDWVRAPLVAGDPPKEREGTGFFVARQPVARPDLYKSQKGSIICPMLSPDVPRLPRSEPPDAQDRRGARPERLFDIDQFRAAAARRLDAELEALHDPVIGRFQRFLDALAGEACREFEQNAELARIVSDLADRFGIYLYGQDKGGQWHAVRVRCVQVPASVAGAFQGRLAGTARTSILTSVTLPRLRAGRRERE